METYTQRAAISLYLGRIARHVLKHSPHTMTVLECLKILSDLVEVWMEPAPSGAEIGDYPEELCIPELKVDYLAAFDALALGLALSSILGREASPQWLIEAACVRVSPPAVRLQHRRRQGLVRKRVPDGGFKGRIHTAYNTARDIVIKELSG